MKLLWTRQGWDDYLYWQGVDAKMVSRINELIRDMRRSLFQGIGKPEPLRNELSGWWARRITQEHRIVYRVTGSGEAQAIEVTGCPFRYLR
ncbi:Txe/YoeB family addiction module toxin [Kumtagia ephedrae]|uniref:Putative mRNA interferase YoeB n=1 Tax=Kumtagia ephedrae TaxID=2116701 RepID=A0A2P7SJA1_9HYPH|nr:Txe/YoeB family addiction module toxin [Mesorhizobium ephedrae]PSJ62550.1 Txe/YoeB family addiction module toxin [Mesorhizobium ephedrae]